MTDIVSHNNGVDDGAAISEYWRVFFRSWRLILVVAVVVGISTYLVSRFVVTQWYRAYAVLRPLTPEAGSPGVQQAMQMLSHGGFMSAKDDKAQEDIAILKSYSFTTSVLHRYGLAAQLVPQSHGRLSAWEMYKLVSKRFSCDYNRFTGNLTLYFVDPNPELARRILSYYVDSLRSELRAQEIARASAAITSLREEAQASADMLLQNRLYDLLAHQIESQRLARVDADFAFTMIEAPVVPDTVNSPRALVNAILAFVLAALGTATYLRMRESQRMAIRRPDDSRDVPVHTAQADGRLSPEE